MPSDLDTGARRGLGRVAQYEGPRGAPVRGAPRLEVRPWLARDYAGYGGGIAPHRLILTATTSVPLVFKIVDTPYRPSAFAMGAPYRVLQTMLDGSAAPGNAAHWRSVHLAELSDPAIDQIVSVAAALPTPFSLLNGWMLGGLSGRIAPAATAFGERGSGFELRMIAAWAPGDEPRTAWVRESWQRFAPYSDGRQYATFSRRRGHRRRPGCVRRRPGAAGRPQGPLRSGERLPAERQHSAEREVGARHALMRTGGSLAINGPSDPGMLKNRMPVGGRNDTMVICFARGLLVLTCNAPTSALPPPEHGASRD
jgi:hypothetical protein